MDDTATLQQLKNLVITFRDERNWEQFHDPKNLAMGLSIEAAELQELFLWKTREQSESMLHDTAARSSISHELADVFIYVLYLAHGCGIDLADAVTEKLRLNAEKYPVDKSYGSSRKYTELNDKAEG